MAVGDERAHAELVGPGEGLAVVRIGGRRVRRVGLRGDLAEEAQDPGFVAALPLAAGELDGPLGHRNRIVPTTGQEVRFPEMAEEQRVVCDARHCGVGHRLLQEGGALVEATREGIRIAEMGRRDVDEGPTLE